MGIVYVLGAGFSKTCGIATDGEMLDELEPLLVPEAVKPSGETTAIKSIKEQVFENQPNVGFETFMTTLSSLKFMGEYMSTGRNIFREDENEVKAALRQYLKDKIRDVDWRGDGKAILQFAERVDWKSDYVITFNYDLLLETAAKRLKLDVAGRILHLHGAIGGKVLAWPTYTKFAYRKTKEPLGPLWKEAFHILRQQKAKQAPLEKVIFIGYSMPPSDLEAKSLFKYVDWYNEPSKFKYQLVVVNPDKNVEHNYNFLRRKPIFHRMTLEQWLDSDGVEGSL
jgi:hypothetical protein